MSEYKEFFKKHKKAFSETRSKKDREEPEKRRPKKDYSVVHDSYEYDYDNYEHIAYGKTSEYYGKGDYEYRDNGQFGSTVLEDDIDM